MPRYLKIRGVPGRLCEGTDVLAFPPERPFLGKKKIPNAPKGAHHVDTFEDVEQVVLDDPWRHVRKAAKDGDLELLSECVANDHLAAIAFFNKNDAPEAKAAAKKAEAERAKAHADAAKAVAAKAVADAKQAADEADRAAGAADKAQADAEAQAKKQADAGAAKEQADAEADAKAKAKAATQEGGAK